MSNQTMTGERFRRLADIEAATPITAGRLTLGTAGLPTTEQFALGKLVELRRRSLGITARQLAEQATVPPAEIQLLEFGIVNPVVMERLSALAVVLRVPEGLLLHLASVSPDSGSKIRAAAQAFTSRVTVPAQPTPEESEALDEFIRAVELEVAK